MSAQGLTPREAAYIRSLALRAGATFTMPHTRAEATRVIARLRALSSTPPSDVARERREIAHDLAQPHDDAAVRDHEIEGYGSTARWLGADDRHSDAKRLR